MTIPVSPPTSADWKGLPFSAHEWLRKIWHKIMAGENVPANQFYGSPNGVVGLPDFRSLVPADLGITFLTNTLGGDVSLSNTSNYFDGPKVAQGTSGTWLVFGSVVVTDPANVNMLFKLWDGTNIISSPFMFVSAGTVVTVSLSGVMTSPAGDLRISVNDNGSTNGKILFNVSGNGKDSTITAVRIG